MKGRFYKVENNKLNTIELPIKDTLSYSRIDVFKQCPYRYKLKYIDGVSDCSVAQYR